MDWLQSIDTAIFRFINLKLSHPVLDAIMPHLAGTSWFVPVMVLLGFTWFWKGNVRARLFLALLGLALALGDGLIINVIKNAVGRMRPFHSVLDAHVLVGLGRSGSMPSSHSSTWAAIAFMTYAYYPRISCLLIPFALLMAFSRVYLGVHYPTDVLAGLILGAGYAAATLWMADALWRKLGPRYFPLWWERLPRFILRSGEAAPPPAPAPHRTLSARRFLAEQQLFRLAHVLIFVVLGARLLFLTSNRIDLSEDEAYQWVWSKHLALSYYSKPLMIALAHWLGTHLWGDTEFGVRFLPPVLATIIALITIRFMRPLVGTRAAVVTVFVLLATPMLAVGSTLMTIDPLLVTFWTAALVTGWRALQPDGTAAHWLLTGLWTGLGFLSKYTALFLIPSALLYFLVWKPSRVHLRRAGPWLALVVVAICAMPVLIWNAQHGWVTIQHVSENAKLEKPWKPTATFFLEFLGAEFGLLNPVFFVGILVALIAIWRRRHHLDPAAARYFFCLGAPVFLGYWAYTFHSRVQANWIAPAVVPLLCLMVVFWKNRWSEQASFIKPWLIAGITLGVLANILLCDTALVTRLTGIKLPAKIDPTRRVRGIEKIAQTVRAERQRFADGGTNVFIVTSHYGLAGQLSFYVPEAKAALAPAPAPLVYPRFSPEARNQFYFWPEYRYWETRQGQSALYVMFADEDRKRRVPDEVAAQFGAVDDLGQREIKERGQVLHTLQLFLLRSRR